MKFVIIILVLGFVSTFIPKLNLNFSDHEFSNYLKSGSFKGYFTPSEFWSFHNTIKNHPDYSNLISQKEVIGQTIKKNKIYGFYICNDVSKLQQYKKSKNIIMMTALHHSREPLTITMIILMVFNILTAFNQSSHNKVKELLRDNILFFVPTLNIDSYLFITNMYKNGKANENVLMIRKNRNISKKCSSLYGGVDLNRNYDYKFALDNKGSSGNPCDEDYRGPKPFSEKETQAIKNYIDSHNNIVTCMNLHSYGNAWIYPFNYTHDGSDKALKMKDILFFNFYKEFEHECKKKGSKAHFGNSAFILDYAANGEAGDWITGAKHILNMDLELGNSSKKSDSFYPPKSLIPRIVRYNWLTMRDFLSKHIINLDLTNVTVEHGNKPNVIFEIFNKSVSSLRDVELHIEPVFKSIEKPNYKLLYAFKKLPTESTTKFLVHNNIIKGTFDGRHSLEIDVDLDSESLLKDMIGLKVVIKRNEGKYFGYSDQKYTFKIKEHH